MARLAGESLLCKLSGPHNQEANSETWKLLVYAAKKAILIGLNGRHVLVHYVVLFKIHGILQFGTFLDITFV